MSLQLYGLNCTTFPGVVNDIVFILAGIHSSELSGIEVANWVKVKLAARSKPTHYSVAIVSEIFPERARAARTAQWKSGSISPSDEVVSGFREIPLSLEMTKTVKSGDASFHPARHFPPPGLPLSSLKDGVLLDRDGRPLKDPQTKSKIPMLVEMRSLSQLIEAVKPLRILTLHGKHLPDKDKLQGFVSIAGLSVDEKKARQKDLADWDGASPIKWANWFGVFVDPRYSPDKCKGSELEGCKFDLKTDPAYVHDVDQFDTALTSDGKKDDQLDLDIAKAIQDKSLVSGNHLDDASKDKGRAARVHYAKEPGTGVGWSLGDWGPVEVKPKVAGDPGERDGAPVFTFEVAHYTESFAFFDGDQIMGENGKPVSRPLTPAERAAGITAIPYERPRLFNSGRSSQLQQYADAIIKVALDQP